MRSRADPRIDALRAKMECVEDPQFTRDYHDPEKRSIANALSCRIRTTETCWKSRSNIPSVIAAAAKKDSAAGREVQDQPAPPLS